jgi:hypothetical protein
MSEAIRRALAKAPADRPSATAFVEELEKGLVKLRGDERTRRPAFPGMPPASPSRGGAGREGSESERATDVVGDGGSRSETIGLSRRVGAVGPSGNTAVDRQSRFIPAEATPQPRHRRGAIASAAPVAALLTIAVALPLGAWLGTREPGERPLTVGGVNVQIPDAWSVTGGEPDLFGGLVVERPQEGAVRAAAGRVAVSVAQLSDEARTLEPTGVESAPKRLSLDGGIAYAYDTSSTPKVQRRVTVVPAGTAAIAVACRWPSSAADGQASCDRALASLHGVKAGVSPAAEAQLATAVGEIVATLGKARGKTLPVAPAARAAAATALGRAHARAATALAALTKKAPWDVDLRSAADRAKTLGERYDKLATAARRKDRAGDASARKRIASADESLRTSFAALAARSRAGAAT